MNYSKCFLRVLKLYFIYLNLYIYIYIYLYVNLINLTFESQTLECLLKKNSFQFFFFLLKHKKINKVAKI